MLSLGGVPFAAERTILSDGTVHILVSGGVDAVASSELLDALIGGITPGRTLIVDLASATYIDDTGMAALAVADHVAVLHRCELRLLGCTGEAEHLLMTTKSGPSERTSAPDTRGPER